MCQHTQLGTVIVLGLVLALIFTLWFGVKTLWHPISTILLAVLLSLLPFFYSLTVGSALRCHSLFIWHGDYQP